jgi:thioredoxin reductase (NADPH)
MAQLQSIREQRYDQIYPTLDPLEIERVRRFGTVRSFAADESLWTVGQVAPGLMVILTGKVAVTERDQFDNHKPIGVHGPGNFLGELALLSGRPALVDAIAQEPVEALIVPSEHLRALMIAEAELGERIMRALILRRVAILQAGIGGPIILGRAENGDVLRLEGFLRRNGHPYQLLNPENDAPAKVLIERFHIDSGQLPIVLCPSGQLLRNPGEAELARCLGLVRPIDPERLTMSSLSVPDRPVLPLPSMRRRKGCRSWCSIAVRSAAKPAHPHGSKTTSASLPESPAWR